MKLKQRIKNWLLKGLLCAVIPEQVAYINKQGKLVLNGQELTPDEAKSLLEEVGFIEKTRFWDICQNTLVDQARQVMFDKSTSFEDMMSGKLMLRSLDVIKKILESIKNYK